MGFLSRLFGNDEPEEEEVISEYCEVGDHMTDGITAGYTGTCLVCGTSFCHEHQGNPDVLAGEYVACPEHVEEVEEINNRRYRRW